MVQSDCKLRLPTSNELPDTDSLPVDNELHNLVPNLLKSILGFIIYNPDYWRRDQQESLEVYRLAKRFHLRCVTVTG